MRIIPDFGSNGNDRKGKIKESIANEEKHFENLMKKVDKSQTIQAKDGSMSIFCDKNGNTLFQSERSVTGAIDYRMKGSDGNSDVVYSDIDNDGNMDLMFYCNPKNMDSSYTATDRNDDGTFDTAVTIEDYKHYDLND